MHLKILARQRTKECQVHGSQTHTPNKSLLFMVAASLSLIIWHVWVYGPTGHEVNVAAVQKSFPLLLGNEIWDLLFNSHGALAELREIFPYFIVGILLAGYLRTYKIAVKLHALLRRYGIFSIFIASTVGIITPLCACGTVTTAISLLFAGLPLAPVMSLMITSSLLSPSTFLLTLNDLGPEWTVIRTIAAYSMGIFAGTVTHLLRNRGFQTENAFIEGAITKGDFHDEDYPDERLRCNCRRKLGNRVAVRTGNKFLILLAKSLEMIWPVGKYVLVGVAMGIIVERYIPPDWIYQLFGQKSPLSIVWITLASVPMFLHQISASSIIYHIKSSIPGTLDGGAALAFMIGGPVTAIPTMVMFWTIFKKRVFVLYMVICVVGTIMISYAFQFLVFVPGVDTGNPLLKGVKSISGGNSLAIRKLNKDVRIVMDPGGKNIIASYDNTLERQGGIVFDADGKRFLKSSADKFDNRRYIANIADWLEGNNSSPAKGNILIYEVLHENEAGPNATIANFQSDLKSRGFAVRMTDRRETPGISSRLLERYSQIWILFGGTGKDRQLTDGEIDAVTRFVDNGKSMLIVAGTGRNGDDEIATTNRLSSRYGVLFSGRAENREEIHATIASHMLNRASEFIGMILKQVHKA